MRLISLASYLALSNFSGFYKTSKLEVNGGPMNSGFENFKDLWKKDTKRQKEDTKINCGWIGFPCILCYKK